MEDQLKAVRAAIGLKECHVIGDYYQSFSLDLDSPQSFSLRICLLDKDLKDQMRIERLLRKYVEMNLGVPVELVRVHYWCEI